MHTCIHACTCTHTHTHTHTFMQHDDRETPQRRRPNFSRVSRNSDSTWPPQDFRESIGRPRRYSSDERYQRERQREQGRGEREWVKNESGESRWGMRGRREREREGGEREMGRGERRRGDRMREETSWRDRGRGWDTREGGRRWNRSPDRWQHDMFEQLEDQEEEEEGEEEGEEEEEGAQRWR